MKKRNKIRLIGPFIPATFIVLIMTFMETSTLSYLMVGGWSIIMGYLVTRFARDYKKIENDPTYGITDDDSKRFWRGDE